MNFKQFFYENINKFISKSVWNNELQNNDELRVGVELMKKINELFPKGEIYIVGGVARDLLLGDKVADVDLATNIPFADLENHFELRDISKAGSQPVNKLNYKNFSFDLAQFRVDSKTHGRENNVSTITNNFEEDSKRRDITINAFGLTSNGEIIDYQGGIDDINNKVIKAVGDAKERFLEDASRILRIVRFAAKLGFQIEKSTKDAIIEMKDILVDRNIISAEAISKEFYKAAKNGKTLRNFIEGLISMGILIDILPEFQAMEGLVHSKEHHPEGDSKVIGHILECLSASKFNDPVINLGVLLHDFGKATTYKLKDGGKHTYYGHEAAGVPIVQKIFDRMKFPDLTSTDKEHILNAVANHMLVHGLDKLNIKTLTKLINNTGWEVLKSVSYCDEASRGSGLFNPIAFEKKIQDAEAKVAVLGDAEGLRKRIKEKIDGQKLMLWFPILNEKKALIGKILPDLQDFVLDQLNNGHDVTDKELFAKTEEILRDKKLDQA